MRFSKEWSKFYPKKVTQIGGVKLSTQISQVNNFIQNYSVYLKHFKRNKFDVRNAYFMRKAFLARNAFYTQIAFYACNAFNTCNASFQIGVPFWSSSHIFSVFRTTNYAHVRGTLQVTHTSGTVGI